MIRDIATYDDLLAALSRLTAKQRKQAIQIADPPNDGKPTELQAGIAIGTVGELELEGSRSVVDNKYHAGEVVILVDGCPFSEDGAMSYEIKTSGPDGKKIHRMMPIYGKGGRTKREEQYAPKHVEVPSHIMKRCGFRSSKIGIKSK